MREDRAYLEHLCEDMSGKGMVCAGRLAMGDPATELVRVAAEEGVDLIAMSTHGHRFLQDLLRGSTADRVRHGVSIPVLMVRAK
jgi:manganese transport protein